MQFKEIIDIFCHLPVVEKRCISDEFIELVFRNEDLSIWFDVIANILGSPRKPKGEKPTKKDLMITACTGSIRVEQTLFEKEFEEGIVIGKFWPWQDNLHTTLRMALLVNTPHPKGVGTITNK
jgi:hypothetical protein